MPVTQRGDSWQAQVNHKGERYRRQFTTKKDATLWEADTKVRLLRGEAPEMGDHARREAGRPHTLGELIEHVYETHWAAQAAGEKAIINARHIVSLIGPSLPISRLTNLEVDRARAALLKTGNAPATVNRKVACLSKALAVALGAGLIPHRPKLGKYRESEHRIRRFSPTEEAQAVQFFERIGHPEMVDYVLFSLDTGLRQGEVLEVRYEDAQGAKVTVWGTGAKSGKTRSVPLTARARGIVERRLKEAGGSKRQAVFAELDRHRVAHYWSRLREVMKLQDDAQFVPHIMRHEFCSRLADRGLNAAVIKELAGHSTLAVTQRYIHIGAQALVDAIAALEDEPTPAASGKAPPSDLLNELAALKARIAELETA
jgi:integrase